MDFWRKAYLYVVNTFRATPTDDEIAAAAEAIRRSEQHTWADTARPATGACWIVYPSMVKGRPPSCTPNMTQEGCQLLAAQEGGVAQPVIPNSTCR